MKAAKEFQLNANKQTLFIFGGSQGSATLNLCATQLVETLPSQEIQLLWQTGIAHYYRYKHLESSHVKILPYVENMPAAYALSDLVLSRAGALTLSEITVCGKPSILIPLPFAAGDHQTKNAQSLVEAGAAMMIPEKELSAELITNVILELLQDLERLGTMAKAALQLGKPQATETIVDLILELAES
jgi:UDP-N-acetylglucosamine--N-acetylmuramyl-(pentapeptide) pyrophosphoryl-undecaprenol N-acetylglucosamine transferase